MKRFETLQGWIQNNFQALVMLAVAGGFALTAVELVLMHHTEDSQVIAVGATALGAVLALGGLWAKGGARVLLAVAFGVLALSGLFGTVEHLEEMNEEKHGFQWKQQTANWLDSQGSAYADEDDEKERGAEGGEEEGEHGPPPLAPLSVSGLAFLGALAVLAKKE